jgi:ribosomal RNA-processing protein 12
MLMMGQEIMDTFTRVATMLEASFAEQAAQTQAEKQKQPKDRMPPTSHTLMDLVITLSIYLPRSSFSTLFNIAALIINKNEDPQLQKKAYKLIPRLAESEQGREALVERSPELQKLLLDAAEQASAPTRRDRLTAISQLISSLPSSDLSFIPCVLSEVVIASKEVNEKARTAAFDLLVLMADKMTAGGKVVSANVPHLGPSVPDVNASLEEYFTMVSAGLAGTTPHMVSASITALSRLLYQFHGDLSQPVVVDLVQTMDLFLTSKNREIVRSVLGFVKVCILSLPASVMKPRLETLIPNLMVWSHEHKAQFKVKVKHIFERLIRKFGVDLVERYCPEEDKKLITNIRKTRERKKRRKTGAEDHSEDEADERKGEFESEFDRAVYSSDESDDNDEERELGTRSDRKGRNSKQPQTFIVEDEDEPLDLLSRNALGNISSTKPLPRSKQQQPPQKRKAKTDLDGKLILKDSSDEEAGEDGDNDVAMDNMDLASGINAYVDAIRGADAARRGAKGKLKFKNVGSGKKGAKADDNDDDEMDIDDKKEVGKHMRASSLQESNGNRGARGGRGGFVARGGRGGRGGARGGPNKFQQRRGLGAEKVHGARVQKSPRGNRSFGGGRR